MLVVAQDAVFEHKPSQLVTTGVVCPLFQVALHFSGFLGAHAVVRGGGALCTAGKNGLLLDASLGGGSGWRALQDGAGAVVLGVVLGQLALAVAAEGICAIEEQQLGQLDVLFLGGLVQESAASIDDDGVGGQLAAVDIEGALDARVLQELLEGVHVSGSDELLDAAHVGVDEDGAGQLQLLEDVGGAGEVERGLAIVVCDGVVDAGLVEQHAHDGGAAEGGSQVEGRVAVAVAAIDLDGRVVGGRGVGQDEFDDGHLCALHGQMQHRGAFGLQRRAAVVALGLLAEGPGDGGRVAIAQRLEDAEQPDRLLNRRGRRLAARRRRGRAVERRAGHGRGRQVWAVVVVVVLLGQAALVAGRAWGGQVDGVWRRHVALGGDAGQREQVLDGARLGAFVSGTVSWSPCVPRPPGTHPSMLRWTTTEQLTSKRACSGALQKASAASSGAFSSRSGSESQARTTDLHVPGIDLYIFQRV